MSTQHASHNSHQVLNLTASSQAQLQKHQAVLIELEAKKIAATIDVPTLPDQVRNALRQLGEPVRLFGENLANVRGRLRMILARQKVSSATTTTIKKEDDDELKEEDEEEEEVTKYTRATPELVVARQEIAKFSLQRAKIRLEKERTYKVAALKRKRINDDDDDDDEKKDSVTIELEKMNANCKKTYKNLANITLEGTQYGDSRSLSSICTTQTINNNNNNTPIVATGSWKGTLHLWDGTSPVLKKIGEQTLCHEDRIMGLAIQSINENDDSKALICTTSIDLTAKLWKVQKSDIVMTDENNNENNQNNEADDNTFNYTIKEQAHLKGHAARLCRAAFHPMKRHVATTSFDHSWRLWDIEYSNNNNKDCLLLQDGHWKEVYGINFHPDGSLCTTTDYGGIVHIWDIRTGKSIRHYIGHSGRVLNSNFHPINGYQLATSGDDGTIKIYDLRKRRELTSIPAHSNIITKLTFDPIAGEYLLSSSFDGTIKIWNTRNWKILNTLHGHEGKVTGVDVVINNNNNNKESSVLSSGSNRIALVSCGFDKTLKMWQ